MRDQLLTAIMGNDERAWWKIASKLEKSALLAAVNSLAGLAIFFFGSCPRFLRAQYIQACTIKEFGLTCDRI